MTETTQKPGAMLKYLCILFAAAILVVTMSFVVRQQTAAAEASHSAVTDTNE